ncbi:MAG: hypothetical protein GC192_16790 [Bacteroidetes bacterium]|nr:hypothetical protein [Bacteroidota bacterium]
MIDTNFYLEEFQKINEQLNPDILAEKQLEVAVGTYLDAVFLKLYKKAWSNPLEDALTAETRIFFAIWIDNSNLKAQRIAYNIHALKLRKLKGYSIESRKFAASFRDKFKHFENDWPHVNLKLGPLTLLEGWINFDEGSYKTEMLKLAQNFYTIAHLVDNTLNEFKK